MIDTQSDESVNSEELDSKDALVSEDIRFSSKGQDIPGLWAE